MKGLIIVFLISTFIMGIFDNGNVTGALVLGVLSCPVIFDRKERIKGETGKRRGHPRCNAGTCIQKSFEKTC